MFEWDRLPVPCLPRRGRVTGKSIQPTDEDELRLKQAADIKLRNLLRNKSLISLAVKKIITNTGFYLETQEHVQSLKCLPGSLREKLLHELTHEKCKEEDGDQDGFERQLALLEIFLSTQTIKISLNGILTFSPEELYEKNCTKVLLLIQALAPNIRGLTINNSARNISEICTRSTAPLNNEMVSAILSLKRLKFLKVDEFAIPFKNLMKICKTIENLRYVDVMINFSRAHMWQINAKTIKSSFSNLTVFLIFPYWKWLNNYSYDEEVLSKICLEHLPNIQVVRSFATSEEFYSVPEREQQILSIAKQRLSANSRLQHLEAKLFLKNPKMCYPEVTHLKINTDLTNGNVEPLLQFSKLKSIAFENVMVETVHLFMDRYRNLSELYIKSPMHKNNVRVSFGDIFKSCPMLKKLYLKFVIIDDHSEPVKCCSNLEELDWSPMREGKVCLSNILSAPNLKKVTINMHGSCDFDLQDLEKVASLISQKKILQKLTSLRFWLHFRPFCIPNCLKNNSAIKVFTALRDVIANASAFLPKLDDLKVKFFRNFHQFYYNIYETFDLYDDINRPIDAAFDWVRDPNYIKFIESMTVP